MDSLNTFLISPFFLRIDCRVERGLLVFFCFAFFCLLSLIVLARRRLHLPPGFALGCRMLRCTR